MWLSYLTKGHSDPLGKVDTKPDAACVPAPCKGRQETAPVNAPKRVTHLSLQLYPHSSRPGSQNRAKNNQPKQPSLSLLPQLLLITDKAHFLPPAQPSLPPAPELPSISQEISSQGLQGRGWNMAPWRTGRKGLGSGPSLGVYNDTDQHRAWDGEGGGWHVDGGPVHPPWRRGPRRVTPASSVPSLCPPTPATDSEAGKHLSEPHPAKNTSLQPWLWGHVRVGAENTGTTLTTHSGDHKPVVQALTLRRNAVEAGGRTEMNIH